MDKICKRVLILFLLTVGAASLTNCQQSKDQDAAEKHVDFKTIETDALIGSPIDLIAQNDTLLINQFGTQEFLMWLSTEDGSVIKTDLRRGNGPREMLGPLEVAKLGDSLMILDRPQLKVYRSDYMCDTLYSVVENIPHWASQLFPLGQDSYLAVKFLFKEEDSEIANTRFAIIRSGKPIVNFGSYPKLSASDKQTPIDGLAYFHQSFGFCKLPDNRFAVTTSHVISIYAPDGNSYRLEKEVQIAPYEYTYTPATENMSTVVILNEGYDRGAGVGIAFHDGKLYVPFHEGDSENIVILCYDTELNLQSKIVPSTPLLDPFVIDGNGNIMAIGEGENSFIAVSTLAVQDI